MQSPLYLMRSSLALPALFSLTIDLAIDGMYLHVVRRYILSMISNYRWYILHRGRENIYL